MNVVSKVLSVMALGVAFANPASRSESIKASPPRSSAASPLTFHLSARVAGDTFNIELSEEGKAWIKQNEDVYRKTQTNEDGGLIDASKFLAPDQEKRLNLLIGKKTQLQGISFEFKKLENPENGYQYALKIDYGSGKKERWYISGQAYYKDQFPDGEPAWMSAISIWKATDDGGVDKLTQNYLEFYKLARSGGRIDSQYLLNKVEKAKEYREQEAGDLAKIKAFDLPKDEPIGYIGLADGHDLIFQDGVLGVKSFAEVMSSLGYNMVSNEKDGYAISPEVEPEIIIKEQIKEFLAKGINNIYIKLAGHGNEYGVYFTTKDGQSTVLTTNELKDIFNSFPECNFIVSTDACSGGGYADVLKKYKDPTGKKGRVTVFLQSKIDATNQEGRLKGIPGVEGAPKIFSTYYTVSLVHHLLDGKTYGEAHLLADKDTKQIIQCDAEAWRSGPDGGISTTKFKTN